MTMDYISDAVSRFIQSPAYLQPLLEFIDKHCSTFEVKDNKKLECKIHENFKQHVDGLISDYLASLDVPVHEFVHNLSRHTDEDAYDTLVKSILIVDDFALFKDMMLKRKSQLYEENELYEPMDLELLEDLNITQPSDLDEVIDLCYRTWERQKVQNKATPDPHRATFMLALSQEEKDTSKNLERPTETQQFKPSAAYGKSSAAETFSATCKNVAETYSVAEKPHKVSLIVPTKTNLTQSPEQSERSHQGAPLEKRRGLFAQPRDQMFPRKKVEREKKFKMTDDSENRRSNPYLQRYLKRESLAKSAVTQEDEVTKRREALMRELASKLEYELTRNVIPAGRNFSA